MHCAHHTAGLAGSRQLLLGRRCAAGRAAKTTSGRRTTSSKSSSSTSSSKSSTTSSKPPTSPPPGASRMEDRVAGLRERLTGALDHLTPKQEGDVGDVLMMSLSMAVLVYLSMQLYRLYAYAVFSAGHSF